jgi:hypothetical protein
MENTYWDQKGKFQAEYNRMSAELMPASGACDTVAGELIRSVSRLGYDFYNNGMGNNTSGAVNFLRKKGAIDPETYRSIYPYTTGALYRGDYNGDALQVAIERAVDMTVEMILRNPQLMSMPNLEDLFDYQDPTVYEDEDEDEDEYYDDEY